MKEHRLYKMTSPEIKEGIKKIDAVLIPVGATEQHGPHLPLDFDHFCATQICEAAAKAANTRGKWVVVAPTINYGCSWYHMNFSGTMSLSQQTFIKVVSEVCESLAHHGFKNLIVLNAHGGNTAALTVCLTDLYAQKRIRVVLVQWGTLAAATIKELGIVSPLIHAEEIETSMAMALGSDVRMDKLTRDCFSRRDTYEEKGIPTSRHITYDAATPGSGVIIPMDYIDDISSSGIVGDSSLATKEKGEILLTSVNSKLVELIEDLSKRQITKD